MHRGPSWREARTTRTQKDLTDEIKMDDPYIIYAFHFYDPYEFTTDIKNPPLSYPEKVGENPISKD